LSSTASYDAASTICAAFLLEPAHPKDVPYRKITGDFVSTIQVDGKQVLKVGPASCGSPPQPTLLEPSAIESKGVL
jgi:hypothetical protein